MMIECTKNRLPISLTVNDFYVSFSNIIPHFMAKKNVFISHISGETEIARLLKQKLDADFLGLLDVFVSSDFKSIKAGENWLAEIEKGLKTAHILIVLCSKDSIGRPWVNFEAGAVWLRKIPVIPVCHSNMKLIDLPVPYNLLQGIEVSQADGLKQLYDIVAETLGTNSPSIDFAALSESLKACEQKYLASNGAMEKINNPKILCAASEQYAQPAYEFDLDVQVVEKMFPGRVTVERKLTRKKLFELMTGQQFDILHLVLAVDPDSGDLIFSETNYENKPSTEELDLMSPTAFAALLGESKTKLVVLATCKALLLAVEVSNVANMAASDTEISGKEASAWAEYFYELLVGGKSVFKAFDITKSQMKNSCIKGVRFKDVCFAMG
jgi:TIR domain-containing protein